MFELGRSASGDAKRPSRRRTGRRPHPAPGFSPSSPLSAAGFGRSRLPSAGLMEPGRSSLSPRSPDQNTQKRPASRSCAGRSRCPVLWKLSYTPCWFSRPDFRRRPPETVARGRLNPVRYRTEGFARPNLPGPRGHRVQDTQKRPAQGGPQRWVSSYRSGYLNHTADLSFARVTLAATLATAFMVAGTQSAAAGIAKRPKLVLVRPRLEQVEILARVRVRNLDPVRAVNIGSGHLSAPGRPAHLAQG